MLNINKLRILKARLGLQFPTLTGTMQLPNAQQLWQQNMTQQLFQNPYLQPQPIATEESYPIAGMSDLQNQYFNDLKEKQNKISSFTNAELASQSLSKNGIFPNKFGNMIKSLLGNFITGNTDLIGNGLDIVNQNLFGNTSNSIAYNGIQTGLGAVSNVIGMNNPVLGLGIKAGSVLLNGLNKIGAKKARTFSVNQEVKNNMGGSYSGSYNFIDNAASHSGEKVGLFSRGKLRYYNRDMDRAQELQNILAQINKNTEDFRNMSNLDPISYNQNINGGIDFRYAAIRKHGGRIKNLKNIDYTPNQEIEPIIDFINYEPNQDFEPTIELFKDGGKTEDSKVESKETNQKNIIPEGALHAHKHHMENDGNITKKGIPVIDNNGEQQAEIEREEWTMTLELTKTIEELYKEYYSENTKQSRKDELAIEAGKILVYEILHNTEDRANLIKRCKEGGTLDES